MIQDRWCDVKVPEKQEKKNAKVAKSLSAKIYVAKLSATITTEDLKVQYIYVQDMFGPVQQSRQQALRAYCPI